MRRSPRTSMLARPSRDGFTLAELLVVVTIIVLVMLIALPAFGNLLRSSSSSLASAQVTTGLRVARDAAVASGAGEDTAAVFFFEPGGRTTMVACRRVGTFQDFDASGDPVVPERELFVPIETLEPLQLPERFMVRGYAPTRALTEEWYGDPGRASRYDTDTPNWVFPETGFFPGATRGTIGVATGGRDRQTFMVRFEAGSGRVVNSELHPVCVLAPRATSAGRGVAPFSVYRVDEAEDRGRFVQSVLRAPAARLPNPMDKARLLGDVSGDTVLARPVDQLAIYDVNRLAAGLGIRVNRETGCEYVLDDANPGPVFAGATARQINRWINGDTNFDGRTQRRDQGDRPEARIFYVDRLTSDLKEVEVQQ